MPKCAIALVLTLTLAGCAASHELATADAGACSGSFFCYSSCDTGALANCIGGAWVCPAGSSATPPSGCCTPVSAPPRPGCRCDGWTWTCPSDEDAGPPPPPTVDAGFTWISPPASFPCGPTRCVFWLDYCVHSISDVFGEPDRWYCAPLPASCRDTADVSCTDCFPGQPLCHDDGAGAVTLTSPGG